MSDVGFQERKESFLSSGSIVINRCILESSLEEFDGREALDIVFLVNVVGSSVHLGNDQSAHSRQSGSNIFINGSQALAVSAPKKIDKQSQL
jgi:hypothetical protein